MTPVESKLPTLKEGKIRRIVRMAFLMDFTGHPQRLIKELDEVAAKGYRRVAFFVDNSSIDVFRQLALESSKRNLEVCAFTGFMKYQEKYLSEHLDQYMRLSKDARDQHNVTVLWGCPFNPDFKRRYHILLREIAMCPAVVEVWVNDEGYLGFSDDNIGCYCNVCQNEFKGEFGYEMPIKPDWNDTRWKEFLRWRFNRWVSVHREMKEVLSVVNHNIRTVFLSDPAAVDLYGNNPWVTGVDLAAMAEEIDGVCTDPYYTFHEAAEKFQPREVYLSEWCRFLAGITPRDKNAEIVPQGFSHPTFMRPLGEEDGYWSGIVPVAVGIDYIAPYCYTLQQISPILKSYERCFQFDQYFEKVMPLKYAAIVHGFATEVYRHPFPCRGQDSYDGSRLLPCSESLRHRGIPYAYLPDSRLNVEEMREYPVVVLPNITCLAPHQAEAIRQYYQGGGSIVALGELGLADNMGNLHNHGLLEELFGVELTKPLGGARQFEITEVNKITEEILTNKDGFRDFFGGIYQPLFSFKFCHGIKVSSEDEIIAEFVDERGERTGHPAAVIRKAKSGSGRAVYLAGLPSRLYYHPVYKIHVQNLAHVLLANAVVWAANCKPNLCVKGWPPEVPMARERPVDSRLVCSFEFFPLEGQDSYIGVVTSYFKEPTSFEMTARSKEGKNLVCVKELVSNESLKWEKRQNSYSISVNIGFCDPIKIFLFSF